MSRTVQDVSYNIINIPIDQAINNKYIASGITYLILLDAPPNANVRIKIGAETRDEIPLPLLYTIEFDKSINTNIYLSCDAVAGGSIKIGVCNDEHSKVKIIPNPLIQSIQTIGDIANVNNVALLDDISPALETKLARVSSPYDLVNINKSSFQQDVVIDSADTISYASLDCDMIKINCDFDQPDTSDNSTVVYAVTMNTYDAAAPFTPRSHKHYSGVFNINNMNLNRMPHHLTLEGVRDLRLQIRLVNYPGSTIDAPFRISLEEYNLIT